MNIAVPTGHIGIIEGDHGLLEFVSLGDYGKDVNLKADFMGLDRVPMQVRHTDLMPLSEKWVITVSTQYGCSMGCTFCDVPSVGPGKNASARDIIRQVLAAMALHPNQRSVGRLNLHLARMGEPTWNMRNIFKAVRAIKTMFDAMRWGFHPVLSTMCPDGMSGIWASNVKKWCERYKLSEDVDAGLQLSINSTDDAERDAMFSGNAMGLSWIGKLLENLPPPMDGCRKYTLNFAVSDWEIDPAKLLALFDPEKWLIKLTPMHQTAAADDSGLLTHGDSTSYAPYDRHEQALKAAGYDVIVFIASEEEDSSRITCGNAILADKTIQGAFVHNKHRGYQGTSND